MKRILLFALLLSCVSVFAQPCKVSVSQDIFQQNFNQIAILRGDAAKQARAEQFVTANCMSSAQVKSIAQLFSGDSIRLIVCMKAYPHITDYTNFFVVYDAFNAFSYALRLYDYTQNYRPGNENLPTQVVTPGGTTTTATTTVVDNTPPPPPPPPVCSVPDQDFQSLLQEVRAKNFDDDQLALIKLMANDRCFNVAQLKILSDEFSFDDEKMDMFKHCYAKCPDKENYYQLVDKLAFTSKKDELRRYINAGGK